MGRDLTLYPEDASKNDLKKYLESWGFIKCGHLWDWPQGTLNYSWFVYDEFKSIDGVSADIFPVVGDDESITKSKWALHVRNTYSASWHDVKMLNDVLRGARKLFGGIIKGDYGTNRYAPLWEDKSSPLSRGLTSTFRHVEQQIKMLEISLPDGLMQFNKHEPENKVVKWMQTIEPRRILYNGLVPFAVSIFEFFFSQSFQILIKYDEFAINKLQKHSMKVEFADILNISEGHLSIEQLISSKYSFQNITQVNKAFNEWLNIDFLKIISKKRKIGNKVVRLNDIINDIIKYRHGVIHHLLIDTSMTKEEYINILTAVRKTIEEFTLFLENKYSIEIEKLYYSATPCQDSII